MINIHNDLMKKISHILFFVVVFLFLFRPTAVYSYGGKARYKEAAQLAKEKRYDSAFMIFRSVARNFPESGYGQKSLFAVGEYFYGMKITYEAIRTFSKYIKKYPDTDGAVFARAYLLKIMQRTKRPSRRMEGIIDDIKMDFFSEPLFLLFSEYKEATYESGFGNQFKIRYHVDMIEIYKNERIYIKITP